MLKRGMGNNLAYDGESGCYDDFVSAFKYDCIIYGWDIKKQAEAIEFCLVGKAKKAFDQMQAVDKEDIKKILDTLKGKCIKSPEYYLNLFYSRQLKQDEKIGDFCHDIERLLDKGMPGLELNGRSRMLMSRLVSTVPSHIKSFLELQSDKSWSDIVSVFDKSVDYKEMYTGNFQQIKQEPMEINKMEHRESKFSNPKVVKFNGSCNFCGKFGHKSVDCLSRINQSSRKESNQNSFKRYSKSSEYPTSSKRTEFNQERYNKGSSSSYSNNNKYRSNQSKSYPKFAKSYTIDAELDELEDYESLEETTNTIYVQNCTHNQASNLVRVSAVLEVNNQDIPMNMLVDSGATASFISPDRLPKDMANQVEQFLNNNGQVDGWDLKRADLTIRSARKTEKIKCATGQVKLRINEWVGNHDFIFANVSETGILGIDFLKKFKANFDFEKCQISIKDNDDEFRLNYISNQVEEAKPYSKIIKLDGKVCVKASSENLVKVKIDCVDKSKGLMFEPKSPSISDLSRGVVWANSVGNVQDDGTIYVSVLNASNNDTVIENGTVIGVVNEAEVVDDQAEDVQDVKKSSEQEMKIDFSKIKINQELSIKDRNNLVKLILKYVDVFQWSEFEMGNSNGTEHKINTGDATPLRQRAYRLPQAAQEEVDRQIKQMLRSKVIEESHSPWSSPIILVKKKVQDGQKQEFRFCIDFRKLNQVTVKDSYPLPRIDDTIDALGGSKFFSTLDLASGYWQIPLARDDKEKTAFIANNKLYHFSVMPFGLCNAPSTFQRLMDTLLRNLTWKYCLVYLDDVMVYSRDFASHLYRLDLILSRFKSANLKLKPSKCCFGMSQVNYLGYCITSSGLKPDQAKTQVISKMEAPKNKDDIKRFLGMMSYYRRFIPEFSTTAACLFELTKAKMIFQWTSETQEAFERLKEQLVKAPVLVYPDFKKDFAIYTDASGVGIGAVLTQMVNVKIHPVAYGSRQLNVSERNYSTSEREMLAIVWASRHFQAYIYGRHIKFFTDHKPLSTLVKSKEPNGRLYKLLLKLQELDYSIVYCPGKQNNTADVLSRITQEGVNSIEILKVEHDVNALDFNINIDWEFEQEMDREIAVVKLAIKTGDKIDFQDVENASYWKANQDQLIIERGTLYLKGKAGTNLVIVPKHKQLQICSLYHDAITSGHLGFEKTFRSLESRFSWPGIKSFVYDYCKSCDTCQKFKLSTKKGNKHPLVSIKVNKIWDLICVDVAGPLKMTIRGNRFIIIAIDHFSKFVVAKAVPSYTAEITVMFLKEDVINKFGTPLSWLTDQGRNFEANIFKEFCQEYSIKKLRTTGYHPQCNGLVERTIKTIKQMLCAYVNSQHDNWDLVLSDVVFAYNNNIHSSTGYAPNQVVFKKILPSSNDRALEINTPELRIKEKELTENIVKNINQAQTSQKKQFDKNSSNKVIFEIGDFVLLINSRQVVGHVRSFEPKYMGPFVIKKKINECNYEIVNTENQKIQIVHYDRMVKYNMRRSVKNLENFNQEQLDDDWRQKRSQTALIVRRLKEAKNPTNANQAGVLDDIEIQSGVPIVNDQVLNEQEQEKEDQDRNTQNSGQNFNVDLNLNEFQTNQEEDQEDSNQDNIATNESFIMDRLDQGMVELEIENQELTEDESTDFQDTNTTILDKNKDEFKCGICGQVCKSQSGLKTHMTRSVKKHEDLMASKV